MIISNQAIIRHFKIGLQMSAMFLIGEFLSFHNSA